MTENEEKRKVVILTHHYKITGDIALSQYARLTDYILQAKTFIAVTDAQVTDHSGKPVFTTSFLNVQRRHIEIILPAELFTMP